MSVKRYSVGVDGVDPNGNLVKYEDYAVLEARYAALAAENAGLKEYLAPIGLSVEGTPATDAFLAEVRAQGVDMAIEHLHKKFQVTGRIGVPVMALEWLAQELRKGVQS